VLFSDVTALTAMLGRAVARGTQLAGIRLGALEIRP
jgi:hypothetical protein